MVFRLLMKLHSVNVSQFTDFLTCVCEIYTLSWLIVLFNAALIQQQILMILLNTMWDEILYTLAVKLRTVKLLFLATL